MGNQIQIVGCIEAVIQDNILNKELINNLEMKILHSKLFSEPVDQYDFSMISFCAGVRGYAEDWDEYLHFVEKVFYELKFVVIIMFVSIEGGGGLKYEYVRIGDNIKKNIYELQG